MKKTKVYCPYCGARAALRPSSVVYGEHTKNDGYLYICDRYPKCDAYVGAHQKSRLPMGTLANGDLRHKRIEAHMLCTFIYDFIIETISVSIIIE